MQKFGAEPLTKQEVVANTCPMNCGKNSTIMKNTMVMVARPQQGGMSTWWSRCQLCLSYWETSPAGKILALKRVMTLDCCPECRDLLHNSPHICARRDGEVSLGPD